MASRSVEAEEAASTRAVVEAEAGEGGRASNCCTRVMVSFDCWILEPMFVSAIVRHASKSLSLSSVVTMTFWNPANCFAMSWTPTSCCAMESMAVLRSSIEAAISIWILVGFRFRRQNGMDRLSEKNFPSNRQALDTNCNDLDEWEEELERIGELYCKP